MSGPPSATLNHNYVPGMLRLHYHPETAAIFGNILVIAALASKHTMHHIQCFFLKSRVGISHKTSSEQIQIRTTLLLWFSSQDVSDSVPLGLNKLRLITNDALCYKLC